MNELAGDIGILDEGKESTKPAESKDVDISVVQDQQVKAGAVRKQIKKSQDKNTILSKFLTKVLGKFGVRSKVINSIFHVLEEDDENGLQFIYCIFYPFIDATDLKSYIKENLKLEINVSETIDTPGKYIDFLRHNKDLLRPMPWKEMKDNNFNAIVTGIVDMLESIRIGGKDFWEALKEGSSSITYDEFITTLKSDIKGRLK